MRLLFPGMADIKVATEVAKHFNAISQEFEPLQASEIPCTFSEHLPVLQRYQVAGRIRSFKKPKAMVRGDLFPELMTKLADFLAIPLTDIFNTISATKVWPKIWKEEFVTVIPKKTCPSSIDHLRNISCTKLASKIFLILRAQLDTEESCP